MNQLSLRDALSANVHRLTPVEVAAEPDQAAAAATSGNLSKWLACTILLATAAATIWVTTAGARDCRLKPIPLVLGVDMQVSATVQSGAPCSIRARTGSAWVEGLSIDSPPRHGELAPRGRTGVFYRPDPKFKGEDSFAFALRGGPRSSRATSVIRVRVTVE
jgi:hypothetical protein